MSSPFSQLIDSFTQEDDGDRVHGVRYAEVVSVDEDGYTLNYLSSDSDAPSAPARMSTLMAGAERGCFFMPEPGDEVVVAFADGNKNLPVIIGCLWSDVDAPPANADTESSNNIRTIVSRLGHHLTFDDSPGAGKVTLETAGHLKLEMDDAQKKITIQFDESNKIELSSAGVDVIGKLINLNK